MKSLSFTLLLGVLLTPWWALAQPQSQARLPNNNEKWLRVQTENFTIYTNAEAKLATLTGNNLERLRKTLVLLADAMTVSAPVPTSIFLFKNDRSFEPYVFHVHDRKPSLAGYFLARADGNYLAINAKQEASQIIFHEYLHFFTNNNLPGLPLWLNEGLAEYYRTFFSDDDKAHVGLPVDAHLAILQANELLPLEQLWEEVEGAIFHEEESHQGIFYAQSWLLVHYLSQGAEGSLAPHFSQFFKLLAQGRPQEQAVAEAFAMDKMQLEANLKKYLRQSRFNYTQISSQQLAINSETAVTAMSRAEVLFHLGDLLAHLEKERWDEAEAFFREAIALAPNYAPAHAGLGYLEGKRGRVTAARSYFEKAIELEPARALTHYQYGACLMENIKSRVGWNSKEPAAVQNAREAREAFRNALAHDAQLLMAGAALGETFLYAPADSLAEGISALAIAAAQLPSRMDVALNLLTLYARAGDSAKAQLVFEKVFKPSGRRSLITEAQERLLVIAFEKAVQLFTQNQNDEALAILDRIAGSPYASRLQRQLKDLRKTIEHKRHIDLYGSALIKAANKKFEEAAERLQQVVAACEDAELKKNAEQSLQEARYHQQVEWYNQAVDFVNKKQPRRAVPVLQRIVAAPSDAKLAQAAQEVLQHIQQMEK